MNETTKAGFAGAGGALVVVVLFTFLVGSASTTSQFAAVSSLTAKPEVPALRLDFGRQLRASQCNGVGEPVVNVSEKVQNDADSGEAGNYWAFDTINRTIQVWNTADANTYCAVVRYTGSFQGIAGQTSPGNTGVLTGNERGTMQGGYAATITGTLLATSAWKTHGNVGTVDYACDQSGNCPGAVNWVTQYFNSDYTFDYDWWGWIYHAGGKKTWINASTGNEGDVI